MLLTSLRDLYLEQLRDLYNAETQLVAALPMMASVASHAELRQGFEEHLAQTRDHVARLERIFADLGASSSGETCEAMQGLIQEGQEIIEAQGDAAVKDAALIAAAQRVEHYEIAGYGTVRTYANHLGYGDHADLLQTTLDEEGATDKKLTALAEGSWFTEGINAEAQK